MKIRVAIFEDNDSLRNGLSRLIEGSENLECVGAFPHCNAPLEAMQQARPDVVLMDIGMPGTSGIEGVKIIKTKFPEIKILMQTVFDDSERIFQSICAGASGYILKNTPSTRILESIHEAHTGGAPMSPTVASLVLKMVHPSSSQARKNPFNLTEREKQVLSCLVKGMSYKLIAEHCSIRVNTVRDHIRSIYEKLHVHSKTAAVIMALNKKIV